MGNSVETAANLAAQKAALICTHHPAFTAAKLSAVCAPVAVAIGILVTYLCLNRFRFHVRILKQVESLRTVLDAPEVLLQRAEDKRLLNQVERNFLAIYYFCGSPEIADAAKRHKKTILNGGMDTVLRWLLTLLTQIKLDRIFSVVIVFILCGWEVVVSWVLFTTDDPPKEWGGPIPMMLSFGLVLAAFAVPLLGTIAGECVLRWVRASVTRWTDEENIRQAQAADTADINVPAPHVVPVAPPAVVTAAATPPLTDAPAEARVSAKRSRKANP